MEYIFKGFKIKDLLICVNKSNKSNYSEFVFVTLFKKKYSRFYKSLYSDHSIENCYFYRTFYCLIGFSLVFVVKLSLKLII